MRPHELLHAERLQLRGGPCEMLVVGGEQVQATDHRSYRRRVDRLAPMLEGVDYAGVAAAEHVDQAPIGLNDECHVFGHGVFDIAVRTADPSAAADRKSTRLNSSHSQ